MISIIICSANAEELKQVSQNIDQTIGVLYEIIGINNNDGKRGICEVYNEGRKKARYDILCFMHEDIEIKTENWGLKLSEIFSQNKELGLIGIAGGGYKSVVPSSWYNADLEYNGEFYCNLIQGFKYAEKPDLFDYRNPKNEKLAKVACIDGCWMCTRKSIAEKYPFDENLLRNFHGYDLDFSLAVSQEFQVGVTYEILLRHFSEGNFSKTWLMDTLQIHKKWSWLLPVNIDQLDEKKLKRNERNAFKIFLKRSLDEGYSHAQLKKVVWQSRHSRIFPLKTIVKILVDLWKM